MVIKAGDKGAFGRFNRRKSRSPLEIDNSEPKLVEVAGYRTIAQMVAEQIDAGLRIVDARVKAYPNE